MNSAPDISPQPTRWKIAVKLPLVVLWLLLVALPVGLLNLICRWVGWAPPTNLFRLIHGGLAALFQIKADVAGEICQAPSTLYVGNHASYLDIFVIGQTFNGSYVAKSEVASWPVLGKLAGIQNTLFLTRKSTRAASQVEQLADRLARGRMFVFPEGTSTPGTLVEPFRSSLFAAAAPIEGAAAPQIQPVTIAYTHYDGAPMTPSQRDRYAWYLPMAFGPHFLAALGLRTARAAITFHPPVRLADFASRKACAQHCEDQVRAGLLSTLEQPSETCPVGYQPLSRRWRALHPDSIAPKQAGAIQ